MGMLQVLANSTDSGSTQSTNRHLLLENFMDVNRWAKEYIRTKFEMTDVREEVAVVSSFVCVPFFSMFLSSFSVTVACHHFK